MQWAEQAVLSCLLVSERKELLFNAYISAVLLKISRHEARLGQNLEQQHSLKVVHSRLRQSHQ